MSVIDTEDLSQWPREGGTCRHVHDLMCVLHMLVCVLWPMPVSVYMHSVSLCAPDHVCVQCACVCMPMLPGVSVFSVCMHTHAHTYV